MGLLSGDGLIIGAREGAPIRGVTIGARGGSYREEAYNWIYKEAPIREGLIIGWAYNLRGEGGYKQQFTVKEKRSIRDKS